MNKIRLFFIFFIFLASCNCIFAASGTHSSSFTISNITNHAPTFDYPISNSTVDIEYNYIFDVNCSDVDLDPLTYYDNTSLFDINSTNGLINFITPTVEGNYSFLIICGDGTVNISTTFILTVQAGEEQGYGGVSGGTSGTGFAIGSDGELFRNITIPKAEAVVPEEKPTITDKIKDVVRLSKLVSFSDVIDEADVTLGNVVTAISQKINDTDVDTKKVYGIVGAIILSLTSMGMIMFGGPRWLKR